MYTYDDYSFATEEEFLDGLQRQKPDEYTEKSGIPLLYEDGCIYSDTSEAHTLIFGNTGSKKTRNFCIPGVYAMGMAGESMVISDPKGEIYRNTSGFLAHEGYRMRTINFREPAFGNSWNPLDIPYQYYKNGMEDKALELVADLAEQLQAKVYTDRDPYWSNMAKLLLEGMILILFQCAKDSKEVHMGSIQYIRKYIALEEADNSANIFWDLVESFPEDSMIRNKLQSVYALRRVEKTLMCVLAEFDAMINDFFINRKILEMMSSSEIDYEDLFMEKTAFYLIMPDEKRTFHFLVSIFVKQCYEYLVGQAQKQPMATFQRRINFVLDEFSNFSKIHDMPSMISAGRSRNIRFTLIVQSRRQLYSLYKEEADTIKSNCRNWIFLASRELELLQELEKLCGQVFVKQRGYRPILSVTDLQQLFIGWEDSQALVFRAQKKPYLSWVKDFSMYPQANYPEIPFSQIKEKPLSYFNVLQYLCERLELKNPLEEIDIDSIFDD